MSFEHGKVMCLRLMGDRFWPGSCMPSRDRPANEDSPATTGASSPSSFSSLSCAASAGSSAFAAGLHRSERRVRSSSSFEVTPEMMHAGLQIIWDSAAKTEVLPNVLHIHDKRANNRAENSHQPTRERARRMRGFKSPGHAQRFLATFGVIASFFRPGRHLLAARRYREVMRRRFARSEVIRPGFASQ
jgi:hypothetical protein